MIEFIPFGEKNKIQKEELMKLLHIKDKKIFNEKLAQEKCKHIILTDTTNGGYWRPENEEELQEFIRKCQSKSYNTSKIIMLAYKELKELKQKI